MDLARSLSNTHQRIILKCACGEDVADRLIEQQEGGKIVMKRVGDILRKIFHLTVNRLAHPQVAFFPTYGVDWYILPMEKDLKVNHEKLRATFQNIIDVRREEMKKPDF